MSAENRLREAAIAAEDNAANIMGTEGYDGGVQEMLAWTSLAERLHGLADRRDARDFTEPEAPPADVVWISRDVASEIRGALALVHGAQYGRLRYVLSEALA